MITKNHYDQISSGNLLSAILCMMFRRTKGDDCLTVFSRLLIAQDTNIAQDTADWGLI